MRIEESKKYREIVLKGLGKDQERAGWPHQHELSCVRKGITERFMYANGKTLEVARSKLLTFLRGNMRETPIAKTVQAYVGTPAFVHRGVIIRPDVWVNEEDAPFAEIKSTLMSSRIAWELLDSTGVGELDPRTTESKMKSYFEQCARYCVATGTDHCILIVYFENGDYADRRKNCPETKCDGVLGPIVDDFFRDCPVCGYRSYKRDLRVYTLRFTQEELAWYDQEYFVRRAEQFNKARSAKTKGQILAQTEPSPNFWCRECEPGRYVGCEFYGKLAQQREKR